MLMTEYWGDCSQMLTKVDVKRRWPVPLPDILYKMQSGSSWVTHGTPFWNVPAKKQTTDVLGQYKSYFDSVMWKTGLLVQAKSFLGYSICL